MKIKNYAMHSEVHNSVVYFEYSSMAKVWYVYSSSADDIQLQLIGTTTNLGESLFDRPRYDNLCEFDVGVTLRG